MRTGGPAADRRVHRACGGAGRRAAAGRAGSWPGPARWSGSAARSATSRPASTRRSVAPPSQIDAVRRRAGRPDRIADTIVAATDAVERYAEEARALRGPRRRERIRTDIVAELERADRALGDGRARHDDAADGAGAARASSRPRPRSSAATSTSSTPARRSPGMPSTPRRCPARTTPRRSGRRSI